MKIFRRIIVIGIIFITWIFLMLMMIGQAFRGKLLNLNNNILGIDISLGFQLPSYLDNALNLIKNNGELRIIIFALSIILLEEFVFIILDIKNRLN